MKNTRIEEGWLNVATNRDMRCKRLSPSSLILTNIPRYGVASGAEAFATSIASGMEGVFVGNS